MAGRDIIVVGASLGGVDALSAIAGQLPVNLPAAVLMVQHTSPHSPGLLAEIIDRKGKLPAVTAEDGASIEAGHIYVAPPDRHLLLAPGQIELSRGPRVNRSRPAVDPLFESAAAFYGERVVGVVLSGGLNDGTAGLLRIKGAGGTAVVQDPGEALDPSMPQSAIDHAEVDYVLPISRIGALLEQLAREPIPASATPSSDQREAAHPGISKTETMVNYADGELVPISCPECGGPLRERKDATLTRFACKVGHRFTTEALVAGQDEEVERALWVALRTLEDRARALQRMVRDAKAREQTVLIERFQEHEEETKAHAEAIRKLLEERL